MLNLMRALRGLVKPQSVHIDNIFFYVHYKLTVMFLIAFSVLVASRQYFGDPIDCEFPEYPNGELNNYCYVQATFVRERAGTRGGNRVTFDPEVSRQTEEEHVRYCRYYSWVFIALFVQAVFFYIPRYMWKAWEGGRVKLLAAEINSPILSQDRIKKETERLSQYFTMHLHTHNFYAYRYFFCELLNLINIECQIIFLNQFIGEGFQSYGIDVIFSKDEDKYNGIGELFPISTICTFEKYSLTGIKEKLEGICLLTHNPLNEKIYGFLWFWMYSVAVISILATVYRGITLFSSSFRLHVFQFMTTMNRADDVRAAFNKLQIGDWFILILLQKNVNQEVYMNLISELAQSPSKVTEV
ncbi:viral innexin-g1.2 [Ichnoviriform fugitivi]|uniref:Viral innexin-g1.2 n=1 Tax=Ichnoviriform fugitivi TaxID=265522 RepID=A2Q0P6_9VIRU|nr:viral innexin-g1.2 [Ichnoviriform fugitivi]BAF45761.1 viral innexin-g1.2 [Ichnoviriform fugitivi]